MILIVFTVSSRLTPILAVYPLKRRAYYCIATKGLVPMESRADGSAQLGVLLVEDSETIIEFLTMGLTYEGFTVHVVRDGRDAMAAFERVRPHLVLLDVMLPGIDGMTLCRTLRARSTVAIIMLTARGAVEDRIEGLDSGLTNYNTYMEPVDYQSFTADKYHFAFLDVMSGISNDEKTWLTNDLDRRRRPVSRA